MTTPLKITPATQSLSGVNHEGNEDLNPEGHSVSPPIKRGKIARMAEQGVYLRLDTGGGGCSLILSMDSHCECLALKQATKCSWGTGSWLLLRPPIT